MNKTLVLVAAWLSIASVCRVDAEDDWTESAARWDSQSYWQEPDVLQKYTFTGNHEDSVVGQSSVQVDMQVAAERPNNLIELRLVQPKPLDLSKTEAIEVQLKSVRGVTLTPRDVFLCNPGFKKLAIVKWPKGLDLSPGKPWQRAVLDLTEASILDKAQPGPGGEYDRSDVATICLNFTLPDGAIDGQLLIDGLRATELPPPPAEIERQTDGSYVVTTAAYRTVVGANGYLQSLRAGATEFLNQAGDFKGSACFVENAPAKGTVPISAPKAVGRTRLAAEGELASIRYAFDKEEFDVIVEQRFTTAGQLQFALSPEVIAALDGRTDRALRAAGLETGPQINTRLVTETGGVLACEQTVIGYSRMSMGVLPDDVWAYRFLAYGPAPQKLTLRPLGNPIAADAIGFDVECSNPDFLLPGNRPVQFDIKATSYASEPVSGEFVFQVCDYLTREPIEQRQTRFTLEQGQAIPVPTDVPLATPGPYRARVTVTNEQGQRSIEWVFTYHFANYKPDLTRADDFRDFWNETLEELAEVPMDAKLTAVPEQNTETAEVFKVSLATLGGRRVHCWYWKPKKPGRYKARFEVPSSGVYPRLADQVPRGPDICGMWMAIHGLPVDYDPKNPPQDPAAWNYWTHGIEDPQTSMWRTIYASLVRGMDFLCSREEVDPDRIMVSGGSQGGGLTLVLAGLDRRVAFAAPAHSGLPRLDWTVQYGPGFWPFRMTAKPKGQTDEQFMKTLSYFDAANFTPEITCPIVAEVSLLDTVTASGNQICALAHLKPGQLELICDPWHSHASSPRGARLRSEAVQRWMRGEPPVKNAAK